MDTIPKYNPSCLIPITLQNLFKIFILTVAIYLGQSEAQHFTSKHFELIQLTDGVYAAIHRIGGQAICNAGIIDLGDRTLIFDTFLSPLAASDLKSSIEALDLSPIRVVVNSHYHNDHIRGNQVFAREANILATADIRKAISLEEPTTIANEKSYAPGRLKTLKSEYLNEQDSLKKQELSMWIGYFEAMIESFPILQTTLPNIIFQDSLHIHGSQRSAKLLSMGRGHTNSDIVLYLPQEKILFASDLLFINMHPYLADGDPDLWIQRLEQLLIMDSEKVVPGHGPVGTKENIRQMILYIRKLENLTRQMVKTGQSIDAIEQIEAPSPYTQWCFNNFYQINMKFLYKKYSEIH